MAQLTQIVEEIFANFGRGNVVGIVDTFADNIRFVHPGGPDIPYAKDRRGKQQAAAFFADLVDCVEVTRFEPLTYVEQGNKVVALGRWAGRARRTGRPFEADWAMCWTFEGGKVVDYQEFDDTRAVANAMAA